MCVCVCVLKETKTPVDFTVQYWQLAISAFTVNFTGAFRTFAGITLVDGVRMGNLNIWFGSSHPYFMSYVTYLAVLCPATRDFSRK